MGERWLPIYREIRIVSFGFLFLGAVLAHVAAPVSLSSPIVQSKERLFTIHVKDTELRWVIELLAGPSTVSLDMPQEFDKLKVTANLTDVTLDEALQGVLEPLDLRYEIVESVLTIFRKGGLDAGDSH